MKNQDSEYFKWQEEYGNHMQKIGEKIGEKEIITKLLRTMSPEEIAEKTDIPLSEIKKIAEY